MFYNILKAKNLVTLDHATKFDKNVLLEKDGCGLIAMALKKDEIVDTHTSTNDAAIYIIDGEIEIHFEAEKFKLDKGEILMFKKDSQHKVLALKDSKFLIFKV